MPLIADNATTPAASEANTGMAGVGFIVAAFLLFACLDTTAKWLGLTLPAIQIVWMRFLAHSVLACGALKVWEHPRDFLPRRFWLQALRGLFLLGSTTLNFLAVRHLRLDQTSSILFLAPLFVTAFAGPVLGEWAGWRRWAAIGVGLAGGLVIVRPAMGGFEPAMILSFGSVGCYVFYVLMTRLLANRETSESMILVPALVAASAITPFALVAWETPPGALHWVLFVATGIFGGLGHWLLIKAHERAPAPTLAPFLYTQIVWMTLFGYVVFGDVPDALTLLGAAIIIASGLYVLHRERVTARAANG